MKAWIVANHCIVRFFVTTTCLPAAIVLVRKDVGNFNSLWFPVRKRWKVWLQKNRHICRVDAKRKYLECSVDILRKIYATYSVFYALSCDPHKLWSNSGKLPEHRNCNFCKLQTSQIYVLKPFSNIRSLTICLYLFQREIPNKDLTSFNKKKYHFDATTNMAKQSKYSKVVKTEKHVQH